MFRFVIVFFILLNLTKVYSCVCNWQSFIEDMREATVVFKGKVIRKYPNVVGKYYKVKFKITATYKGNIGEYVMVKVLNPKYSDCGIDLKTDLEYVVFGYGNSISGLTGSCCSISPARNNHLLDKLHAYGKRFDQINAETLYNDIWAGEYFEADKKPSYPGGETELYSFLKANLNKSLCKRMEGFIFVNLKVDKQGKITLPFQSIRDLDSACEEEEIIRVIKLMPHWNPGEINGVIVLSYGGFMIDLSKLSKQ